MLSAWYSRRRLYRQLRNRKCTEFYRDKFEASTSNPRQMWNTVDELLGSIFNNRRRSVAAVLR